MDGLSPANMTYGAGAVLALVLAMLVRGDLVVGPTHNRTLTALDKAEARCDVLTEALRKLAESYDRLKRRAS